jgi:hypothetical protein
MHFCSRATFVVAGMLVANCAVSLSGQTLGKGVNGGSIAQLPIIFEQNQGQAVLPTRFVGHADSIYLEMRPAEIDLTLGALRESATLKLDLVGGDRKARITPLERMDTETNYFLGRNPSSWHTHIPNFRRVQYEGVYPGINLVFYGNGKQFEHDFIVAPFADYRQIRMRVHGARETLVKADGSLNITLANGNVIFRSPDVYQESEHGRESRRGRFVLLARNTVGFEIGVYDRSKPLIIDPVLSYETFLANTPFLTFGVATDISGNTYVSGVVATPGVVGGAVGVIKVNSGGTGLVYASYFGGSCQPYGGIAVDGSGNALVGVVTTSANVPLKNPVQPVLPSNVSGYAYVFSLSPDGASQNYASLLPANIEGIALDPNGNAYVSGDTGSASFPVTPGAVNNSNVSSPLNLYATKFLPNGNLGYSALLGNAVPQNGGGGPIGVTGIAVDPLGSAYITGTAGSLWPTTTNAYQKQIPGSAPYAAPFVTKLSADGSTLVYSTFLGSQAQPAAIIVNGNGEAFVAGQGAPATFPTTSNAYQPLLLPSETIASFISELSADGSQLPYSTFIHGLGQFGPGAHTSVTTIAFDGSGNLWLAGTTNEFDFPMVHPLQSVPPTSGLTLAGLLGRLDSHLANLTFSTFIGDLTQGAQSLSLALDANGRVHLAGVNGSQMYTTPGAYITSVPTPPQFVDYLYGFSALIDPSVQAPAICLPVIPVPQPPTATIFGLAFGNVAVGSTLAQEVVITNCGELPLQISGGQSSDPAYAFTTTSNTLIIDFRGLGGWTNAIACGLICCLLLITLVARGRWRWRSAFALTVLLAACLGCGGGGSQATSDTPASATSSPTSGTPTGDVDTCQQAVPVNGSCGLSVSFAPTAVKSYPAVLTITSNASMPLFVPLSGTGK